MTYFLTHFNISMAIIGLIGIVGNVAEPGPVPRLMYTTAGLYLAVYVLLSSAYKIICREVTVMSLAEDCRETFFNSEIDENGPEAKEPVMFDLKEGA